MHFLSLTECIKVLEFHLFPFGGTVLSPPPYIIRPLCIVVLKKDRKNNNRALHRRQILLKGCILFCWITRFIVIRTHSLIYFPKMSKMQRMFKIYCRKCFRLAKETELKTRVFFINIQGVQERLIRKKTMCTCYLLKFPTNLLVDTFISNWLTMVLSLQACSAK